jgi:dienelactone hydrolase
MDPDELFAYRAETPVPVATVATEERDGARVEDIRYGREDVEAYLVSPLTGGAGSAVLFCHWFETESPIGNRGEFLDEAVELAGRGVVSLLPQLTFPWASDPTDAAADRERVIAEVTRLRRGLDLLADRDDVDASRLAVVGHDFGAMYACLLAGVDRRAKAYVLLAGTPRWADWFLPFWQIAGDRYDYLRDMSAVDPITHIANAAPAATLFQFARHDFFIAPMTGMEFQRAATGPSERQAYDAEHDVDHPQARADRRTFLERELGFVGSEGAAVAEGTGG